MKDKFDAYARILKEELKPAMGCTEPIAIAYCSALARSVLGKEPERYIVRCSSNIIKNVKAVTVPQTDGLVGIEAAVLAGAIGGDETRELEVLTSVTGEDIRKIREALKRDIVKVELLVSEHLLHIIVECFAGEESASVEVVDSHTHVGRIVKNGKVLKEREDSSAEEDSSDWELLTVEDILDYADQADISDVVPFLERQIAYNIAISEEGLHNDWGARVGATIAATKNSVYDSLTAAAAAGSDARMNGCALPVIINSGSGNQGITASVPVVIYAKEKKIPHEKLLRALCVSNLISIHQKTGIGKLSAYCGAVSAATGAAAAIAYLDGCDRTCIKRTVINSIATISGMICDGAKSSCASKIASALDCALMGYGMAKNGLVFKEGEGIVKDDVESTIEAVGKMAHDGMRDTDRQILEIMLEK